MRVKHTRSTALRATLAVFAAVLLPAAVVCALAKTGTDARSLEHGRYLVKIAGCNDCHTAGYAASGGKVPESQWLLGDETGFSGPWGTTYPGNLRLVLSTMS